jgi:uncharacterized protein (UPF0303 family)
MAHEETILEELRQQEEELQFPRFTNRMALDLGLKLIEMAKEEEGAVTIDITRAGQQLFHYAFEGTSPDNDQWIRRKTRVVTRFHKSSYRVGVQLAQQGLSIEDRYYVDAFEFSPHGGAFPITVRGVGVIGTVAVSGLSQDRDHALVVRAMREYLGSVAKPADA